MKRLVIALALITLARTAEAVSYDTIYVSCPRGGDTVHQKWADVSNPSNLDPGCNLMRHLATSPTDGSMDEVLVPGGLGSVADPFVSFDAQWVYYAYFPNLQPDHFNDQRRMWKDGSDIYRINLSTKAIERLTHQEFTPNPSTGIWDMVNFNGQTSGKDTLGYGILNLGPIQVAGGRIVFVSSRNGLMGIKSGGRSTLQLYVMNADGSNPQLIAPMNIGGALHPFPLVDGRVCFSSAESQGLRDARIWGIWCNWPDGRHWEPLASGFEAIQAYHFATQIANGNVILTNYYNQNNAGFGMFYEIPSATPAPAFGSPFPRLNPPIPFTSDQGFPLSLFLPFAPKGLISWSPWTHMSDRAAPKDSLGNYVGKLTMPSAGPGNDVLATYSGGPAWPALNPQIDSGIYVRVGGKATLSPADLTLIVNSPQRNEIWPRAVVKYRDIYGVDEPVMLPFHPTDGSNFGFVGTASNLKRESFPGVPPGGTSSYNGLDQFYAFGENMGSNWTTQGADDGRYTDDDVFAIRILGQVPESDHSYGPNNGLHFYNHAVERMQILGEIPLRHVDATGKVIIDGDGNPDTSFLAKIPCNRAFTFQLLDRNGNVLAMAQTWHQVRCGETITYCGGCHSHSKPPTVFMATAAGQPGYQPADLTGTVPLLALVASHDPTIKNVAGIVSPEFYKDIRPVLQRSCVPCHQGANAPAKLALDDIALHAGGGVNLQNPPGLNFPGDYSRLALDNMGVLGGPKALTSVGYGQLNASRYIRRFQDRRSLLIWKIFGKRLDGWSNGDHPTELVPGDITTLPAGADPKDVDVDYTGTIMPPLGSAVPALTDDEKLTFARWVALGAPIDLSIQDGKNLAGWTVGMYQGEGSIPPPPPPPPVPVPVPTNVRVLPGQSMSVTVNGVTTNLQTSPRIMWNPVTGIVAQYQVLITTPGGQQVKFDKWVLGVSDDTSLGVVAQTYNVSVRACTTLQDSSCGAWSVPIQHQR